MTAAAAAKSTVAAEAAEQPGSPEVRKPESPEARKPEARKPGGSPPMASGERSEATHQRSRSRSSRGHELIFLCCFFFAAVACRRQRLEAIPPTTAKSTAAAGVQLVGLKQLLMRTYLRQLQPFTQAPVPAQLAQMFHVEQPGQPTRAGTVDFAAAAAAINPDSRPVPERWILPPSVGWLPAAAADRRQPQKKRRWGNLCLLSHTHPLACGGDTPPLAL